VRGGRFLIVSQYALPHAGVGRPARPAPRLGRAAVHHRDHKLIRLFHVELGRLWKRDAIRRAKDPATALPPRLSQTLNELLAGSSEKQIALKLS
jgi:hypothetical protein